MIERLENQLEKEARDLRVLTAVIEHQPVGIVRLSSITELEEHKVRYSLRMLENDGLIDPTPNGAVAADDVEERIETLNEGIDDLIEHVETIREFA